MPTKADSNPIADALNRGHGQEFPPTTWLVMLVGVGPRPHVTCSTDLALAYTEFLQTLYMVLTMAQDGEFKIAADDYDGALMGLSVYFDDSLILCLQPAGSITPHVAHPDAVQGAPESFEAAAPILLAAMARRAQLGAAESQRFRHSIVARVCSTDIDESILSGAISEPDVAGKFPKERLDVAWKSLLDARAMVAMTAVVKG